jgi:hypothetical protein
MKKKLRFKDFLKSVMIVALLCFSHFSSGQVSITGTGNTNTYAQDFNTLASTGSTSSMFPANWSFSEIGANANAIYSIGAGASNSGDTFSLGIVNNTDRALGSLLSGSLASKFGCSFINNTGSVITELVITYKGETWRVGAANRSDRLDFQYSLDATSLNNGTWVDFDLLDYSNVGQATGSGSELQFANISNTISSIGIANGATFFIRFVDFNATGSDDAMAIDDFSIYVNGGGPTSPEINITGNGVDILDGATPATVSNDTNFGTVSTNVNVEKTFTIENLGSAALVLTSPYVQLTIGGQGFTISQQPTLTTIPVGSSTTFKVLFNSTTAGTFDEGIEVLSNDTNEANYSFDVKAIAESPTPEINVVGNANTILSGDITPSTSDGTDFGSGVVNVSIQKIFTIENTGTGNLVVNDIIMSDGNNYSISGITLPSTINPASSQDFIVTFNSATIGAFNDSVLIDNNDSDESTYDFSVTAQTINLNFQPGDINIVSFATDAPDSFAFVNWVDIPVDADISFTDNAFNGVSLNTNENTLVWKNDTGSVISSGTVIIIDNSAVTAEIGTIVSGALNGLSASNENLFIYENSPINPSFIYGLSNLDWITTGTPTSSNSYLPTSLNVLNANIVLGSSDNYEYSNSRINQMNFEGYKALVNNPSNWMGNNTFIALSSQDFVLTTSVYWTGATDTNWSTASNWSNNAVPDGTKDIEIPVGNPILATNFTVQTGKNLTISGTGALTLFPAASLTIQGTANFNDKAITFKSDATGTAMLGEVTGTLTGATNVTVERYIPARRVWRALTAPLKGANGSLYATWQNGGAFAANTGVEIWGPAGTTMATGPSYSVLNYTPAGWSSVTNTTTANLFETTRNNAYLVFVTGGYGSGNIASTIPATATTLKATGQLITGDVAYTGLIDTKHTLIGNPYASSLSPGTLLSGATNLVDKFWVYDPILGTAGGYVSYDMGTYSNITGSYSATTAIQSGQAFFVRATPGTTGSFTISENKKSTGVTNVFGKEANQSVNNSVNASILRVGMYKESNQQWKPLDGAIAGFYSTANNLVDDNDGKKFANGSENIAFVRNNTTLSSEHFAIPQPLDELYMRVWNTSVNNYKLQINTESFTVPNIEATLIDLFTGVQTPINLDGTVQEYPFAVTSATASTGDRFKVVFNASALATTTLDIKSIKVYPNPVTNGIVNVQLPEGDYTNYSYELVNVLGQTVMSANIEVLSGNQFSFNTRGLANTWYALRILNKGKAVYQTKVIIAN